MTVVFPYFLEIRADFLFVEYRIILQRGNGGIQGVGLGMNTKLVSKGKEGKKKGHKKTALTSADNFM